MTVIDFALLKKKSLKPISMYFFGFQLISCVEVLLNLLEKCERNSDEAF